jgi:hypothetical protein
VRGGGEGYLDEICRRGDLDWGWYCPPSIGCFYIRTRAEKRYNDLSFLFGEEEEERRVSGATFPRCAPALLSDSTSRCGLTWPRDETTSLSCPTTRRRRRRGGTGR